MSDIRVSVIYHSATGNVHALAEAAAEGAAKAGCTVRLRRAADLAPDAAAHHQATHAVPQAVADDVEWADVVLFGTPARSGNVAAELLHFLDTLGPLWVEGRLDDKIYGGFVGTGEAGVESTLVALYNSLYHLGGIVIAPKLAQPAADGSGDPYGVHATGGNGLVLAGLEVARGLGERAVWTAAALQVSRAGRA